MSHVLTVLGHPSPTSFNAALAEAYVKGAAGTGATSELLCLGELRFDPVLHGGYRGEQPLEPDLQRLREAIERAAHVAWVFPVWWGAPPALLKGAIDRTFLPGWAFENQPSGLPKKLLRGRSARTLVTMDAPGWFDRLVYGRSARRAFETATLAYTGFSPVRSTVFAKVRASTEARRAAWLAKAEALGARDAARAPKRALVATAA
ncbi:MAG: NAD(P)H-dependent oxidoreductase [Myxococcota bacterium]